MPDYARGKVYKITSGDLTYIGSTTEPTLAKRLANHVSNYKRWKTGKYHDVTSFQVIELGNYQITLLELCACGSKDELFARERHWVETIPCINKVIPGRTRKEWMETYREYSCEMKKKYYEDHKDYLCELNKKYYEDHKEELKERMKARYQLKKEKISKDAKEKRADESDINSS
jgi:hypothetical protein